VERDVPARPAGRGLRSAPWPWLPLTELSADDPNSITDGPFGSKLKTAHYTDAGPPVVRLTNIGDGIFVDAKAHISESHFATRQKHRVFPRLSATSGPFPESANGRPTASVPRALLDSGADEQSQCLSRRKVLLSSPFRARAVLPRPLCRMFVGLPLAGTPRVCRAAARRHAASFGAR